MAKIILGFDGGYNAIKAITDKKKVRILSVVGQAGKQRMGLGGLKEPDYIEIEGIGTFSFGEETIAQGAFKARREDRDWIVSQPYLVLYLAALSEVTDDKSAEFAITSGLPVAYYKYYKTLAEVLAGEFTIKRSGRDTQKFAVPEKSINIIPQPFGTLFDIALTDEGDISKAGSEIMKKTAGIIDIGGKTVNLLSVSKIEEVSDETASVDDIGGWTAVKAMRGYLSSICPDAKYEDHEIAQAIIAGSINYYDKIVDITEGINTFLSPMANAVVAQATSLWDKGAQLSRIIITGGGANLIGPLVMKMYPHPSIQIAEEPTFANARGYWKYATRQSKKS